MNRSRGITFVALDRTRALTEQGPYDVILHKVDFQAGSIQVWSFSCLGDRFYLRRILAMIRACLYFRPESLAIFSGDERLVMERKPESYSVRPVLSTFETLSMSLHLSLVLQISLDNLPRMSPCPRMFIFIFTLSRREAGLVGGTAWSMAICC